MKKNLLVIISLILATLFVFGACVKLPGGGNTSDDGTTDAGATDTQSPDTGTTDTTESIEEPALLLNNVNIAKYTLIYNGAAVKGSTYARDYFNSTLKELCGVELEKSKTAVDGYNIFIGAMGEDSAVNAFFDTCEDGMLGYDGKNVYLLAQDNSQLYDVVDAFFAKVSDGAVNITQNEKVAAPGDAIKVMSYNVLYDKFYDEEQTLPRDINKLAEFIAAEAPDVFGTQETQSFHKTAILEAMPNYECYEGIKLKGGANMQNMIFWNADKFTLVSKGFRYLTSTPLVESIIEESNSYRGYSFVILESKTTHKQFMFIDVHLTYRDKDGNTNNDVPRYKQAQYLCKFMEGAKYETIPMILVGDFNSIPGSDTIKLVDNVKRLDLASKVAETKGDTSGTCNGTNGTKRLNYAFDHIFVTSDRITTKYFTTLNDESKNPDTGRYLSDHMPVIAEIVIY